MKAFGSILAGISPGLLGLLFFAWLMASAPRYAAAPEAATAISAPEAGGIKILARRIITPEIKSNLKMTADGRQIEVVGHFTCPEGERFTVRTELTQGSTGATATGNSEGVCTGHKQWWTIQAVATGGTSFEEGTAEACAWAASPSTGTINWCRAVRLREH